MVGGRGVGGKGVEGNGVGGKGVEGIREVAGEGGIMVGGSGPVVVTVVGAGGRVGGRGDGVTTCPLTPLGIPTSDTHNDSQIHDTNNHNDHDLRC